MQGIQRITPCLWFDDQAEEAVDYYLTIFSNARIVRISRYGDAGRDIHGKPPGSVMTVTFELDGQPFTALNGGPVFRFNEAISFQIYCATQEEVDYYWERLSAGGDEQAQQCGWLKDKYGVSWQVLPTVLIDMLSSPDGEKSQRAMAAILQMKKPDIDTLKRAYAGIQYSGRRAYFRLFTASSSLADWPSTRGEWRISPFSIPDPLLDIYQ